MEKISSIIPANARTRSVDVSSAQPVRPGAPTWGRPVGRVTETPAFTPEDRVSLSAGATERAGNAAKTGIYNNKAEVARAKVVDDIAKKFFEPTTKAEVRGSEMTKSEEALTSLDEKEPPVPRAIA